MNGIFWLASYPKSGNTWLRIFLTNYLRNSETPADINCLEGGPIASARELFDELVGVEASDLTFLEIEALRPQVYRHYAHQLESPEFLKVHDAYTFSAQGQPLFPPEASAGAIYILRNPLDVAPSFASHNGMSLDEIVELMANRRKRPPLHEIGLGLQLGQRLLSWGVHARSWVEALGIHTHLVRYEDMRRDPHRVFRSIIRFAGLDFDPERLERAITFSSFGRVKQQELEHGFREKRQSPTFFRRGQVGGWRDELNPEQVAQILSDQADVMRQFGYLNEAGQPVEAMEMEMFTYDN